MFVMPKEITAIKKNPVPQQLASALSWTSVQIGIVKGQLLGTSHKKLLWDAMIISEMCCLDVAQKATIPAENILMGICSSKDNQLKQQYESLQSAYAFAAKQGERFGVLPATDYLKIHYFLTNQMPLEKLFFDMEPVSEELWTLFSTFYSEDNDYPKLLDAGIIIYCLEKIVAVPLHPLCKELIVHYAINRNFKVDHTSILICRQLYRYNDIRKPIEDYLRSFLQVLFHAAFAKGNLFMEIRDIFENLDSNVGGMKGGKLNAIMIKELLQNLSVTCTFIEEKYSVSTKTAIGYLKQLEDMHFFIPVAYGRKKVYLNKKVCDSINGFL